MAAAVGVGAAEGAAAAGEPQRVAGVAGAEEEVVVAEEVATAVSPAVRCPQK